MLHAYVSMEDIDVDHWRNLQALLLESAKGKRRIILIHENGELLKFVHSTRAQIVRNVDRVDHPLRVAEQVYRANADKADFVVVFDRQALDQYFAQVQDTWQAEEDLDEFVHRMYARIDEHPEGIVTYPGSARTNLGLQWRLGASYEDVKAAVKRFIPPNTTAVFGIFAENALWASLLLGFDEERRVKVITTADPSTLTTTGGDREAVAKELVAWASSRYAPCSLGLFMDRDGARTLLSKQDKATTLRTLAGEGRVLINPLPEALAHVLWAQQ